MDKILQVVLRELLSDMELIATTSTERDIQALAAASVELARLYLTEEA